MTKQEQMIEDLQINLHTLRKAFNMRADDLALMLGSTKQTIYNLESGKTQITKIWYISIRTIFELKIVSKEADNRAILLYYSLLYDNELLILNEINRFYANVTNKVLTKNDRLKILVSIPTPFIDGIDTSDIFNTIKNDNKVSWMTEIIK